MESIMAGFIKFDGIDGDSTDDKHSAWCDITSYSLGASSPGHMGGGGGGGGAGKVSLSDLVVTKYTDKASPKLFQFCCEGKHVKKVTLEMTATYGDAGVLTYLKIELEDAIITGYSMAGTGDHGSQPSETVTVGFSKIKQTYSPYDEKGKNPGDVPAGWDTLKNKST
jgi:type VI secretion system secreted protein Hcp